LKNCIVSRKTFRVFLYQTRENVAKFCGKEIEKFLGKYFSFLTFQSSLTNSISILRSFKPSKISIYYFLKNQYDNRYL